MVRRHEQRKAVGRASRAWVALGWFWAVVVCALIGGAVALQVLGPPAPRMAAAPPIAAPPAPTPAAAAPAAAAPVARAGVPAPIAALQEPAPGLAGAMLPRIGPDGRMPMQAYAAAAEAAGAHPRVAVLLAGIGMTAADSAAAIRSTPPAVSLAFSPYAERPGPLVQMAREAGHETLVSIPMEPLGYPLNDAGDHALLTGLTPAQNLERLDWALSRIGGYVGATAAMSGLMGERFAAGPQMPAVLDELAARGLLYIAPRPSPAQLIAPASPQAGIRVADLVIDDLPGRAEIEAKLAQLEQIARDRGSALGLIGRPDPESVGRLLAWVATLASRGIVLVPVSALVPPLPPAFPGQHSIGQAAMTQAALRERLPYRANVGAVLFNRDGRVLVARRADLPNAEGSAGGWQLPQGGIDGDEDPAGAVLRELAEEIGTARAEIIGEHPDWLTYDLPDALLGRALHGRYRGQRQRWFALRFLGEDGDIRLDGDPHPEFDAWRWTELAGLEALAVDFKRPIYRIIAASFVRFARPSG